MAQIRSVYSRIRNARNSLDNAERNFRSNQEVRGELDLMLAEAELENLRQKRSGLMSWTRQMLAACLAVMVLVAGGLGWWWASSYGGNMRGVAEKTAVRMEKTADPVVAKQETAPLPVVRETKPETRQDVPAPDTAAVQKPEGSQNRESSIRLSSNQMRQLIRSGKQELRNVR